MTVDKSGDRVRRMFGQIARRYDLLNHLLSLGIDRRWRRRTVRLVPPGREGPILDVCCGTGDLTLEYWRAGGDRATVRSSAGHRPKVGRRKEPPEGGTTNQADCAPLRVVGADFCRPMLQRAAQKAARARTVGRIALVEADALRLPFADNTFQIVTVAFGLRNVSDTDGGLAEMARVCRPGGRVAVLEFSLPTNPVLKWVYGWYFGRVLPRVGQALARNRSAAYNYLPASVGQFPQHEALAERMRAAGLREVVFHPFTCGIATLYMGTK